MYILKCPKTFKKTVDLKARAASSTGVNSLHGEAVKLTKPARGSGAMVHLRYYPEVW
ncbi:hypothetical protein [Desulfosporosinus orientis]|uniref:hypothetical protein n=1 Tax=Desulfosporosinus orientis TaxID=1563 RepID=UPI0013051571|nr:hypothetical protein [Desulfosporosinus orientis]